MSDTGLVPARVRTPAGEHKHDTHLVYAATTEGEIKWQAAVCGYRPTKTSVWVHADEQHLCRYCKRWREENA